MVSHSLQFLVSSSPQQGGRSTKTSTITSTSRRRAKGAGDERPPAATAAPDPRPLRETTHPGWVTAYYWLWRRSRWEVFLRPPRETPPGGEAQDARTRVTTPGRATARRSPSLFELARKAEGCKASTASLEESPGVYEFAICKRLGGKRFKVYVGESSNIRRRHHVEYRGPQGSHLRQFFEDALADGYFVMRRVKYVRGKEAAAARETTLLQTYNYAWNARQNGGCSRVKLQTHCCCWIVARRALER